MTLSEVVAELDTTDDALTIYARRSPGWSAESEAALADDTARAHGGLEYLLEVYLAKEVLEVWSQWRNGQRPSLTEKCEAIIWYAEHDAYMPVGSSG